MSKKRGENMLWYVGSVKEIYLLAAVFNNTQQF